MNAAAAAAAAAGGGGCDLAETNEGLLSHIVVAITGASMLTVQRQYSPHDHWHF